MASDARFEAVYNEICSYIHKEKDLAMIQKAFDFAFEQHKDQYRKSGEAYIVHPLCVTKILAELHVGPNALCAGLLHDVVEDTETTLEELAEMFNPDVASIVDGVTKVGKLSFSSLEKRQATNHQKMLLAMSKDIRVIIVKLADRLHNMRTLDFMSNDSRMRIAEETLEIYAPLADRLGMFSIKAELEDRSLKYLDSAMYQKITSLVKNKRQERDSTIDNMISNIKEYLSIYSNLDDCIIKGRIKNIYSIYKKMVTQDKEFEDIYDILAIRVIVNKIEECYQVLGVIHGHYTPIPKRFKDYIAVPKPNMYQSLHTTIIGIDGQTFEVQIRTKEMDMIAENGVAAHWAYKENVEYSKDREQFEIGQKLKWYAELLNYSEEEDGNAEEFVESIKGDYFDSNVYIYTPTGEVIDLPSGSTPIDFAYKIHTNLGNSMVGAIVNNKMMPLSYELKTGDIVSIRINKNSFGPSEDWLKIVKTSHAKHKIKSFLNKQNKDILIASGKDDVEKEFAFKQIDLELTDRFVKENFSKNNITTLNDLYLEIGKGIISAKTVVGKVLGNTMTHEEQLQKQMAKTNRILTTNSDTGVVVEGLKNPQIKLANCCFPIPGDEISGYVTKGNGIVVHHKCCKNLNQLEHERLIDVEWASDIKRQYPICIKVTASQHPGLLGEIMNTINANKMSIASINAVNNKNLTAFVNIKLLTSSTIELEKLIVNMKKIPYIHNIERENL